jgi:hypothetical protein
MKTTTVLTAAAAATVAAKSMTPPRERIPGDFRPFLSLSLKRENQPSPPPGFTLPARSPEPPAGGFGKPLSKPRLPLKTEQIQISN